MQTAKSRSLPVTVSCLLSVLSFFLLSVPAYAEDWIVLSDGLELRTFKVQHYTPVGDSTITIVRIDPDKWDLKLFAVSQTGDRCMTAREWCDKYNLVVAINAGMYDTDFKTHVGFMKLGDHHNNPDLNHYMSLTAFSQVQSGLPSFRIYDLDETEYSDVVGKYNFATQNLRLIKRPGINRWTQQEEKWSEMALGEDGSGRALFIFCRTPYSMHDFNNILLQLPIDLQCAQHLEGGPEAQLFLRYGETELDLVGSYETTFCENDGNRHAWSIPNIIGVSRKH